MNLETIFGVLNMLNDLRGEKIPRALLYKKLNDINPEFNDGSFRAWLMRLTRLGLIELDKTRQMIFIITPLAKKIELIQEEIEPLSREQLYKEIIAYRLIAELFLTKTKKNINFIERVLSLERRKE